MKLLQARLFALMLVVLLPQPAAAESVEDLFDMSIDELLEQRLDNGFFHTHEAGEMMIGFHHHRMRMEGNRVGSRRVATDAVLADYMVAPTEMDMEMSMFHLMYAPSDRYTLALMVPYVRTSMDHVTRMGARFTTRARGIGDIRLGVLAIPWESEDSRIIASLDLGLPTGEIGAKDETPMGRVRLPYPMQLGSGSLSAQPGLGWEFWLEDWAYGVRAQGVFQLHRNRYDYRLGDQAEAEIWLARSISDLLSFSLRVRSAWWGDVIGRDALLNPAMVPTADPELRGGNRIDFGAGIATYLGDAGQHRLALELTTPVYQRLDGPQLELDSSMGVEWTWVY